LTPLENAITEAAQKQPHCLMVTDQVNGNERILTFYRIRTTELIATKFDVIAYV